MHLGSQLEYQIENTGQNNIKILCSVSYGSKSYGMERIFPRSNNKKAMPVNYAKAYQSSKLIFINIANNKTISNSNPIGLSYKVDGSPLSLDHRFVER